jgi:adenosylhomocysteine nucleosidase
MFAMLICLLITSSQPNQIGIMSAMEVELEFIRSDMVIEEVDTVGGGVYTLGTINSLPCVIVHGGVGKVGAAHTAQTLITHYDVDVMIFTGVAGGINPDLHIGDIVISRNVVHHDFGQILPDSFIPFDTIGFFADSVLIQIARQAGGSAVLETIPETIRGEEALPMVKVGRVATGDQFISSEAKRLWIAETFHADCVEMEGAAMAQVCAVYDVPFVIIRALSDLANEEAEVDFQSFVIYAAKNSSLLVKEMLRLLSAQSP